MQASTDLKHVGDLNRVYIWLSANKLTLYLTKTEFMLVASRQKLSTLSETPLNDHSVMQVSSAKSVRWSAY